MAGGLLFDADGRRQALDDVDLGLVHQLQDESLQALLTQLLMSPAPPLTAQNVQAYWLYLKRRLKRQRRQQLATELQNAPENDEKLQEYWQLRVEHD